MQEHKPSVCEESCTRRRAGSGVAHLWRLDTFVNVLIEQSYHRIDVAAARCGMNQLAVHHRAGFEPACKHSVFPFESVVEFSGLRQHADDGPVCVRSLVELVLVEQI